MENKSDIFGRAEGIGKGTRCAIFLGAFTDVLDYDRIKHSAVHEVCHLLGAYHHTAEANTCLHGFGTLADEGPTSADACRELPVCDGCLARMNLIKTEILFGHVD